MPSIIDLGQKVKTKYPEYNDLSDEEVGRKVKTKFPGAYDDFVEIEKPKYTGPEIAPTIGGRAKQTLGAIKEMGVGLGKEIYEQARGAAGVGEQIVGLPARALGLRTGIAAEQIPQLKPKTPGQRAGAVFGQVASTFVPVEKVIQAVGAITKAKQLAPFAKSFLSEVAETAARRRVELPAAAKTTSRVAQTIESIGSKGLFGGKLADTVERAGQQ